MRETAGWDGVFTYDAIAIGAPETFDPWVVLAAMAMATERVTLGAIVFAPARGRPSKLAREAHAAAGATWWTEVDWPDTSLGALERRIDAGSPRWEDETRAEPGRKRVGISGHD